jgi:hypothetical protein
MNIRRLTAYYMKKLILLPLYMLLAFTGFSQLEMSITSLPSPPNGPVITAQTATIQHNTTGTTFAPFSPTTTVSVAFTNQQFTSVTGITTGTGLNFGNQSGTFQTFELMNAFGSPVNNSFTSNAFQTAGTGISVADNASFGLMLTTDQFESTAQNTSNRIYYGDLVVTFNRPVNRPILHFTGLGGSYTGVLGFSAELDLTTPGVTMSALSGSTNFTVNSTQILNENTTMDATCGSGAVCGSAQVDGTNITTLTFKVYLDPDGAVGTWPTSVSSPTFTSDFFLMGVSLSNASVSGKVFNDINGLTNNRIDGSGSNCGGLYAILVDGDGKVYASTTVAADGNYSFGNVVIAATYNVILSTTAGVVGSTAPAASLPSNWVNTGEYLGSGTGSDGTPNGSLALAISSASITDVNFGIAENHDGDNIIDGLDIDDDNDGVLDSLEGGPVCRIAGLNAVPPYAMNTNLVSSLPLNGLNNNTFGFTASVGGTATWSNGVQIQNNPMVGDYIYLQPANTDNLTTANVATYTFNFNNPVENLGFTIGGLNNQDQVKIRAFLGATEIPITVANFSGFDPGVTASGNVVTSTSTTGGVDPLVNIFKTIITESIDRIIITSGKADDGNGTVTIGIHTLSFCSVGTYTDTDTDGTPNYLDPDSDNDGCSDAFEAGATTNRTVNYAFTGTFGTNGLIDTKETVADNGIINYTSTYNNAINAIIKACNTLPITVNDSINILQGATATPILVLTNDDFKEDGPSTSAITITQVALHGTATVDNNGTPTNPLDDKIIYTPNTSFAGLDSVKYQICDANGDCSIANIRITVLQNPMGLCAGQLGIPVINLDFGTGAISDMPSVYPTAITNYTYSSAPGFGDGSYAIINNGTAVGGAGFNVAEHTTGSATGRMAGFNASFAPGEFLRIPVNGLAPNTKYQYSAWFANVYPPGIKPNVTFEIYDAANNALVITKSTGDFAANPNWFKDGFTFVSSTSANYVLVLKNSAPGGGGNDLVIDDIQFAHCGPTTTVNVTGGSLVGNTVSGCNDAITLTANVQPGCYTTPQYQWQISTDNGVSFVDSVGATNIVLNLVIGTYTHNKQYRLKVAETGNINNATAFVYSNAIIVTKTNCIPVANRDDISTPHNTLVNIPVLGNDSDTEGGLNPASVTLTKNPAHGTFTINTSTDGSINYTPAVGFTGKDTINYQVCDLGLPLPAQCDTALVVITVPNTAPIANRNDVSTTHNTLIAIDVLANDTDSDGSLDPASVILTQNPVHGTFTINTTNGNINYTPAVGFTGRDTLIYRVFDSGSPAQSDTALVVITVPNSVPLANRDDVSIPHNTLIAIDVLGNDTDSDGGINPTTVTVTKNPTNGTFTVNPTNGNISYTPALGFTGKDTLIYRVYDNGSPAQFDTALVVITVLNGAPLANRDEVSTPHNTLTVVNVLGNDTDVDGGINPTTVTVTQNPINGIFSVSPTTGAISYTPAVGFTGKDSLIYRVCDSGTPSACDTAW